MKSNYGNEREMMKEREKFSRKYRVFQMDIKCFWNSYHENNRRSEQLWNAKREKIKIRDPAQY
jgi:hypothetical protein